MPPPSPRTGGAVRRAGVTVLGGTAATGALTLVNAPWRMVSFAVVLVILVPGLVLLAQVIVPEDSEHKRDLWLEWLRRHRDRDGP